MTPKALLSGLATVFLVLMNACSPAETVNGGGGGAIGTGSGGQATGSGGAIGTGSGGKATGSGGKTTTGSGGRPGSGGATGSGGAPSKFSFFLTSQSRLFALAKAYNGSTKGFGGDLRYGETGPGAGLRGADKICAALAEQASPGAGGKKWRAFLSVSDGGTGSPVNAIDRIGSGPWYDAIGRLFANNIAELKNLRPTNADAAIINDFPNEDGVPNKAPDGVEVDNHEIITGSNASGQLYGPMATCKDWTDNTLDYYSGYHPRVGHSWPRPYAGDVNHWISAWDESGCLPGANTSFINDGPPGTDGIIGSGGGYGGFYCFAILN